MYSSGLCRHVGTGVPEVQQKFLLVTAIIINVIFGASTATFPVSNQNNTHTTDSTNQTIGTPSNTDVNETNYNFSNNKDINSPGHLTSLDSSTELSSSSPSAIKPPPTYDSIDMPKNTDSPSEQPDKLNPSPLYSITRQSETQTGIEVSGIKSSEQPQNTSPNSPSSTEHFPSKSNTITSNHEPVPHQPTTSHHSISSTSSSTPTSRITSSTSIPRKLSPHPSYITHTDGQRPTEESRGKITFGYETETTIRPIEEHQKDDDDEERLEQPKFKRRKRSNEIKIKQWLLRRYDKTSRPVSDDDDVVEVSIAMSLYHILDTNEKYQTLSALISLRLRWNDVYLRWDKSRFNNLTTVWIPVDKIWTPDIVINNYADDSFHDLMNTNAIVKSNGDVLWMFPAVSKTYCTLDVRFFPFDNQACPLVFISWTYSGFEVDLMMDVNSTNTIYYTPKNQEWFVEKITVENHNKTYICCVEPYPDVTFTIHMQRRSLFYIMNMIFPCLLIYFVSFLGFFLPIESGEKVNLEITILLALVVFLLMAGETLPPTPDAVPILGMLYGATMFMVSVALVMAVVVTNLYLRKHMGIRVPIFVRRFLYKTCSRKKVSKRTLRQETIAFKVNHENHHQLNETKFECDGEVLSIHSDLLDTMENRRSSHYRRHTNSQPPNVDYEQQIAEEWSKLAKCIDRLFFWVFLVFSMVFLIGLFSRVPANSLRSLHDTDDV